ncbi:MAG: TIGR02302 family protein [Rhizobiaceae bacterium]|nr:TIGR02302 family protein [Rhizobiaceae bacterium]
MTQEPTDTAPSGETVKSLRGSRMIVRATIIVERLWPLVLPFLLVVALYLSASWFGLFRGLSEPARLALAGIFVLCALGALALLRHFRLPDAAEVDRRVETANRLAHTPVQVQSERPGGAPDGFAEALWREHQKRMAEKLRGLGGDTPRTGVPERDPWAIRSVAALLVVTAFAFSLGSSGGSITDAFRPGAGVATVPPRIDAWVTPPGYTGKAPIFLTSEAHRDSREFTVPAGSELALRVTGGSGEETLGYLTPAGERIIDPQAKAADAPIDPVAERSANRQFSMKVRENGSALLHNGTAELAQWTFTVIPDTPPIIHFTEEPTQALNGTLELRYEIKDDYGATAAEAKFELAEPAGPQAKPLYGPPELKLTIPRRGATPPTAKVTKDLTEHVWAGSKVRLTLQATDAAGQTALSETKEFILPERPFTNLLARSVIEQRRIFSLDTNRKKDALDLIDAITLRPEDTFDVLAQFLGLSFGRAMLDKAGDDNQLRAASDYFWELALGIEDGELSDAEKRLKQAREALKQALQRGASDQEIDKLMKELREAMNQYLREFAERAQRAPNQQAQQPNDRTLSEKDLQKMLDEIEKQAKSGNRDAAEELLAQLENLMNNLQAARPQQGENGQQSEMRQQMNKLGEIMRRQQEMMNETHRLDQQQQSEQGEPGEQGENGQRPMTPEEFADAMKQLQEGQGGLQRELDQLMEDLKGMGIKPGEGFGEAGKQMGEAQGALGQSEGERATGHQGQALEALRRGAQDMMQQMQQAMQGDQGEGQQGTRQQSSDRDPLGRPRATRGPDDGDTTRVPDEIDAQRARQILEAIRKRLGNALSPELERSYLERLLEMR